MQIPPTCLPNISLLAKWNWILFNQENGRPVWLTLIIHVYLCNNYFPNYPVTTKLNNWFLSYVYCTHNTYMTEIRILTYNNTRKAGLQVSALEWVRVVDRVWCRQRFWSQAIPVATFRYNLLAASSSCVWLSLLLLGDSASVFLVCCLGRYSVTFLRHYIISKHFT